MAAVQGTVIAQPVGNPNAEYDKTNPQPAVQPTVMGTVVQGQVIQPQPGAAPYDPNMQYGGMTGQQYGGAAYGGTQYGAPYGMAGMQPAPVYAGYGYGGGTYGTLGNPAMTGWIGYALGWGCCCCLGPVGIVVWIAIACIIMCKPKASRTPEEQQVATASLATASCCLFASIALIIAAAVIEEEEFKDCKDDKTLTGDPDADAIVPSVFEGSMKDCIDFVNQHCPQANGAALRRNACYCLSGLRGVWAAQSPPDAYEVCHFD